MYIGTLNQTVPDFPNFAGPRRPTMWLRPLQDRVLIRRVEQEAMTSGGIFIPDTAQENPTEGEVVAVVPGLRNEVGKLHPPDVKVGDRVLFAKWSGTEIKRNGEDARRRHHHGVFAEGEALDRGRPLHAGGTQYALAGAAEPEQHLAQRQYREAES